MLQCIMANIDFELSEADYTLVEEYASIGMTQRDIYGHLGISNVCWYKLKKRDTRLVNTYKKAIAKYRNEYLSALRDRYLDPTQQAAYMGMAINRDSQIEDRAADYSDPTKEVLANPTATAQEKIAAVMIDHANGSVGTRTLKEMVTALEKLASMNYHEEIDRLTQSLEKMESQFSLMMKDRDSL